MAEGKKVLMIIAPVDFKDEEYFVPKEAFEKRGMAVTTASLAPEATGVSGVKVNTDMLLKDATTDYDAIVFVGGPGAGVYFEDKTAHSLAKKAFDEGKVVAAICIAPSTLANAGILEGKKATVFPSEKGNLEAKGATCTGDPVTKDGKVITGKDPSAAQEFAEEIIAAL